STELGRITQAINLSVKAYVLATAASPLFNGNPDYANFVDKQGQNLFPTTYDPEKWVRARDAAQAAIEACEVAGNRLYYYNQSGQQYNVSENLRTQMNIRNSVTERWNYEIVWGNTNSMTDNMQAQSTPRGLDPTKRANAQTQGNAAVPLKVAGIFYSKNGVPIEEDASWNYGERFTLRAGTPAEREYIR